MKAIRYTPQLGRDLCARIADGESLAQVCADPAMPCRATVYRWLEKKEKFRTMFSQACGLREDKIFDEILEKADSADASNAHAVRVMVDARKWVLGRMNPTKYGDRQQVALTGASGGPVEGRITVEFVSPKFEDGDNG
ncbi:MAG: hypothetical protein AB7D47_13140 [Desulfovibrio sp.]